MFSRKKDQCGVEVEIVIQSGGKVRESETWYSAKGSLGCNVDIAGCLV